MATWDYHVKRDPPSSIFRGAPTNDTNAHKSCRRIDVTEPSRLSASRPCWVFVIPHHGHARRVQECESAAVAVPAGVYAHSQDAAAAALKISDFPLWPQ
jgi:hypothetical protein